MKIRFKIDEDLPLEVAQRLAVSGYDAQTVVDERLCGCPDSRIWEAAKGEHRCLVTGDKGFADARLFPPGTHPGIVLLRLPRESRAGYIELIESLLAAGADSVSGAVVTVSPDAIRIRH